MNPQQQPTPPVNQTPSPALPPERMVDDTELPPVSERPVNPQPANSKKKLWIGLAAILVVLVAGGAAGAMWWTSADKVFNDAMYDANYPKGGELKGAIEVSSDRNPTVTMDYTSRFQGMKTNTDLGVKLNAGMMNINMTGGIATDTDKNLYFKVNNIKKTIDSFAGTSSAAVDQYYGDLIKKIDGKWVRMTQSDLKEATKDSGYDMSCMADTIGKISQKSYTDEFVKLYKDNPYMTLKDTVGSESINGADTYHYIASEDQAKSKAFAKAMKETAFYKELRGCVAAEKRDEFDKSADSSNSDKKQPNTKYEVWVDKWSHKLKKFLVTVDENDTKVKFSGTMTDNDSQKVDTPTADTEFKDLKTEVEKLQNSMNTSPRY